jgi:hypothetical protein
MTNADELLPDAAAACNRPLGKLLQELLVGKQLPQQTLYHRWMKAAAGTAGDATNAIILTNATAISG